MPILNTTHHPENRETTVLLRPKDLHRPSLAGHSLTTMTQVNAASSIARVVWCWKDVNSYPHGDILSSTLVQWRKQHQDSEGDERKPHQPDTFRSPQLVLNLSAAYANFKARWQVRFYCHSLSAYVSFSVHLSMGNRSHNLPHRAPNHRETGGAASPAA